MNFNDEERASFYRLIAARRDIRRFRPDPIPEDVLLRILWAAHHAGSVGYMQPWNFIVIRDQEIRQSVHTEPTLAHFTVDQSTRRNATLAAHLPSVSVVA